MKTKIGIPIGLALVMFLGVFTAMLAFGTLSPQPTQAQSTPTAERSIDMDRVTPDGEVTVTLTVTGFGFGAYITETLPSGFTLDSVTVLDSDSYENPYDGNAQKVRFTVVAGEIDDGFTYTVTAPTMEDEYSISGVVETINNPGVEHIIDGETMVTVAATPVEIPMMVSGFMVDNTVNTPGAVSGYRITFMTLVDLVANQDVITVHFDKDFKGHSADLSKDHVTVSASVATGSATTETDGPAQTGAFNPSSNAALERLTKAKHDLSDKNALDNIEYQILVPDMNGTSDGAPGIAAGATVTVVISTGAGITNATEGGDKGPIGVFTSKQTTLASGTVTVQRSLALSSYASNRNKPLTVTGSGFQNGTTATVYLDNNNGLRQTLVSVPVASNDTFEAQISVNVPPFVAGTGNMIFVEDGNQPPFKAGPVRFEVEGLLTVSPTSAAVGDEVDITLDDWPMNGEIPTMAADDANCKDDNGNELPGYTADSNGNVSCYASTVTIAGVNQRIIGSPIVNGGSANFRIEIGTETPSGIDEIKVDTPALGENDTVRITIAGAGLSGNPTTAVPNQAVTVTGLGFTAQATISRATTSGNDASSVTFGNSNMYLGHGSRNFNNGQDVEVDSGGNWSASIIIPITSASTSPGTHKLEVTDSGNRTGSFDITIPQRTLDIDPPTARPGETVTLTGVGFPASNTRSKAQNTPPVSIIYGASGIVGTATPDADGNISMTFRVPLDANIPSTNRVEANYTIPDTNTEVKTAYNHQVPGARVALSMDEGKPGDNLTITGDGFKAFASVEYVRIGGIDVTPAPKPATNRNGEFTATILVPDLADGTNAIDVKVGVTASANFKVLEATASTTMMMPEAEAATPDVAFAAVIAEDNLIAVYHFDPATQNEAPNYGYTVYDARPLFMSGNNLDSIEPGQFYTVEVSENQMGVTLGNETVDLYAPFTPIRW